MSSHYPATSKELDEMRFSAAGGRAKLETKATLFEWLPKAMACEDRQDYESHKKAVYFYTRCNLPSARRSRAEGDVLTAKVLNRDLTKRILVQAAEKEDWKFIIGLGKLLARKEKWGWDKPRTTLSLKKRKAMALQDFLLKHWTDEIDNLPPLCYLCISDIADVYQTLTGEESSEPIKKQCKYLGLVSFQGKRIKVSVQKDGRLRFDKPDLSFSFWSPKSSASAP